jgi:thiamine-monophosphate kinase
VEFARIERIAALARRLPPPDAGEVLLGIGDDAAVVDVGGVPSVLCVDALVDGVHFRRDLSSPADVGWKAVAVNVSDVAAVGGTAVAAVVALHRPRDLPEADVDALYEGMAEAAAAYGLALVGGDTVTSPTLAVTVAVLGRAGPRTVTRSGARPGDVVVVAGALGAAAAALHAVGAGRTPDPAHLAAHRRPRALPATGRALAASGATAVVDVSDGLGADAGHLARGGGVDLRLDADLVAAAAADGVRAVGEGWLDLVLGGGEDQALLATVPPDRVSVAAAAVAAAGEADLRVLGRVVEAEGAEPAVWLDAPPDAGRGGPAAHGRGRRVDHLGYDHG